MKGNLKRPMLNISLSLRFLKLVTVFYHIFPVFNRKSNTLDTVSHFKSNMLKVAFDLLSEKPEMERKLLQLIVNKLGDTTKKIASKVLYL